MNAILWIIFGGLAGWLASALVGADSDINLVGNVILGVIGAFVGGWIASKLGAKPAPEGGRPSTAMGFVWAVIGAIVVLFLVNLIF